MKLKDNALTTIISASILSGAISCSSPKNKDIENEFKNQTEVFEENPVFMIDIPKEDLSKIKENKDTTKIKKETAEKISICLNTDENGSFTHSTVLNSIKDPHNTVLEFPLGQLFEKYGERPHPLAVRGIKKDFRSLLGEGGIESFTPKIPQKLSARKEGITSDTEYMIDDTLRFPLINTLLKDDFPKFLPDQLKEEGFETFSDTDELVIGKMIKEKNESENTLNEKMDHIYDIVVKQVPSGKSALAVYKDGEIFMATYVSVGQNRIGRKRRNTKTGQFKIIGKNPYYFSRKYRSPMPNGLNFDEGGYWFHQGNVTGYPASHGCVRLPGAYSQILYSLLKDAKGVDVFISKSLYESKK